MAKYGKMPPTPKSGSLDDHAKTCKPCGGTGWTCKNCGRGEGECRCKSKAFATCAGCKGSGVANLDELERIVRERDAAE